MFIIEFGVRAFWTAIYKNTFWLLDRDDRIDEQ